MNSCAYCTLLWAPAGAGRGTIKLISDSIAVGLRRCLIRTHYQRLMKMNEIPTVFPQNFFSVHQSSFVHIYLGKKNQRIAVGARRSQMCSKNSRARKHSCLDLHVRCARHFPNRARTRGDVRIICQVWKEDSVAGKTRLKWRNTKTATKSGNWRNWIQNGIRRINVMQ